MKRITTSLAIGACLLFSSVGAVLAGTSPNGPGQPGAPGTTCGSSNAGSVPGSTAGANGSPFNPNGQAGQVYAGNPLTASAMNAGSSHAVSQYDIACFQVSNKPQMP
jgi:hypothetical protein